MAKGLSPTQRTLRYLRQEGMICAIVERFNHYAGPHGIRQDLFGYIDIIALSPSGIVGVQSCSGSTHAAHRKKILDNEIAPEWLKVNGRIWLVSWSKRKVKRGGSAERWTPRIDHITVEDFE